MRQYPRIVYKNEGYLKVFTEAEEYKAGIEGYESDKDPEIIEKRKGTDKEILRALPESEEEGAVKAVEIQAEIVEQVKKEDVVKAKKKIKAVTSATAKTALKAKVKSADEKRETDAITAISKEPK